MFTRTDQIIWQAAKPAEASGYAKIPDGKYTARILSIKYFQKEDNNGTEIPFSYRYEFTILEGEHKDAKIQKRDFIHGEKSMAFLKKDLLTLDCPIPEKLEDVIITLQSALNRTVEIELSTKNINGKEYTNVYINRTVKLMQPPPSPKPYEESPADYYDHDVF